MDRKRRTLVQALGALSLAGCGGGSSSSAAPAYVAVVAPDLAPVPAAAPATFAPIDDICCFILGITFC